MNVLALATEHRKAGRPASLAIKTRRQEEILDAAAKLFAEQGYADASTQTLADVLQVGKGTIYRYFRTKRDLFLATVDRLMRQLKAAVDAAVAPVEDPIEQIGHGIRAYLDFAAAHPELAELMIQERAQFRDRKRPTYFEHREANIGRWRELHAAMVAEGRVRAVPTERLHAVIGDLLYGTMFANYFAGRALSPAEQTRDILDLVFHGILTDGERRRREAAAAPPAAGTSQCAPALPADGA
jgi:AcrR family transcriptional regulator